MKSGEDAPLGTLAQAGGLSLESAQIVQLRAAHAARADHVNVIHHRSLHGENTLHAVAETDLADRYGLAHPRVVARDHRAFKNLQALFLAFFDLDVHFNSVAGAE